MAPKRAALAEANKKLSDANKKLDNIRANVKELNNHVLSLEDSLMKVKEIPVHVQALKSIFAPYASSTHLCVIYPYTKWCHKYTKTRESKKAIVM